MEVAGLVFSAIAFVDSAIKTGSTLAKLFRNCGDAGAQVYSATQRLDAQRLTLDLWQRTWQKKALDKQKLALQDGYQELWGEEGYDMILKCLTQLNIKFGEALRTLRSIDPDSFSGQKSTTGHLGPASNASRSPSPSPSADKAGNEGKGKRPWYKRLRGPKVGSTPTLSPEPASMEERARLSQEAVQLRMSPGTRFQWSLSSREQIRSLINDIDDWMALLQTLSVNCEADRLANSMSNSASPSSIRLAAKALYTALHNSPSAHDLEFKLERERIDAKYFEQVLGPVEFFDQTNRSFKFPLLLASTPSGDGPLLLLAEAVYASSVPPHLLPTEEETSLDKIVQSFKDSTSQTKSTIPVLCRTQHTLIVIHGITTNRPNGTEATSQVSQQQPIQKCTFAGLLRAESTVDPLLAMWKRLQLACIIAISVLHLYETGWISEHLETSDFHFFGSAGSQLHELGRIDPYVSGRAPHSGRNTPKGDDDKTTTGSENGKEGVTTTPFDCLHRNQLPPSLLGSRDERLARLFHRLGIVLFELGRGVQYREVFGDTASEKGEAKVMEEIDKIPFGRPYRDLVKACLNGSLYATSAINIDRQFDGAVVERLVRLEEHFRAILQGDG